MVKCVEEAISYIYKSYEKANRVLDWHKPDAEKRNPMLSREIIRSFPGKPCVLVTGSKGKGSVSTFISQILQTKLKVGMMTSPHVFKFTERFKVNGRQITELQLIRMIERCKPKFDAVERTLLESQFISPIGYQTAIALDFFNEERTDFNIFECGKGVRYDDVNNIPHEYAVINPIFLEHTRELGDSIETIAGDKATIIDGNQKCIYVAEQCPEVLEVIERRANAYGTRLKIYGRDFVCENVRDEEDGTSFDVVTKLHTYKDLKTVLRGGHQAKNCALAMSLCEDILGGIDIELCKKKLLEVEYLGRLEVICNKPFVLLDACINRKSCILVKDYLASMKMQKVVTIIGIPNDKDFMGVAKEISEISEEIILTSSLNRHYFFSEEQQKVLKREGVESVYLENIEDAIERAKRLQLPICILGTTALISDVKKTGKEIWN